MPRGKNNKRSSTKELRSGLQIRAGLLSSSRMTTVTTSLVMSLKPSIATFTETLQHLTSHVRQCKAQGVVLDKAIVMPLFRIMAALQVWSSVNYVPVSSLCFATVSLSLSSTYSPQVIRL